MSDKKLAFEDTQRPGSGQPPEATIPSNILGTMHKLEYRADTVEIGLKDLRVELRDLKQEAKNIGDKAGRHLIDAMEDRGILAEHTNQLDKINATLYEGNETMPPLITVIGGLNEWTKNTNRTLAWGAWALFISIALILGMLFYVVASV